MLPQGPTDLSRRRSDTVASASRVLDWSARPSDIALRPHSPLALADILSREGGCFDLVADGRDESDAPDASVLPFTLHPTTVVRPISSARSRSRKRRERMNLLCNHTDDELQQQCRALLVENALVKHANNQRLYLAAGFIVGEGIRAPVLLYPALLVYKDDTRAYEVSVSDAEPDNNKQAFSTLHERFGVDVPVRNTDERLTDYFARLAATLTPVQGLELVFEVALGNATPEFGPRGRAQPSDLPDVPECFDIALAMALASDISLDELHVVLKLIPDVTALVSAKTAATSIVAKDIAQLRELSAKLASRGLDNIPFKDLPDIAEQIDAWLASIEVSRVTATVGTLFAEHTFDVRQLARLGGIIELVDKAPADIETSVQREFAFTSTESLLRRARYQAQLIEDEFDNLQKYFVMELIPSKSELLQLIEELQHDHGPVDENNPAVVDADYFHARRRFMQFSRTNVASVDPSHRRNLMQLAKVLRFRELFVNNTEYRQVLGSDYRGLRTDWAALTRSVEYARELADVLGSEALAAAALNDFARFRTTLVDDLDTLRESSDALREAVSLFGRDWHKRPLDTFCNHLAETATRLHEWARVYTNLHDHGSKTPAIVLSQFTGQSNRDAETERRVREARARIDDSLRSGRSDATIVAGTLEWLRDASRHASERKLDIGAIVDHLQIA